MNYYILIAAVVLEILFRLIPTKFNLSIIDQVKNVAIQLHTLVDVIIPNKRLKDE